MVTGRSNFESISTPLVDLRQSASKARRWTATNSKLPDAGDWIAWQGQILWLISTSLYCQLQKTSILVKCFPFITVAIMDLDDDIGAVVETTSNNQVDELPTNVDTAETAATVAAAAAAKTPRHRGRHAKDPLGQSISFKCQRIEDMETKLREYLDHPTGEPEHTTLEFSFPVTTAFMVPKREPIGPQTPEKRIPYMYSAFNKTAVSVIDALHIIKDPKEQALIQKAISKTLVESVQRADGYRYSFHNHWLSREDQASRFSYYCNDSVLNKGRAANEGAAKLRNSVKIRKPVFECQGLLSIKFSITKMSLELHYKHVPMHQTYEERAPPPRKDSKRRKLLEIFNPELLPALAEKKHKRKSTPKDKPSQKRRATEPLPRLETDTGQEPAPENSLQPLFDFLGTAEGLQQEPSDIVVSDRPNGRASTDSTLVPGIGVAAEADNVSGELSKQSKDKPPRFPGMMSGFMSGESITWGPKQNIRALRREERSKRLSATAPAVPSDSTTEHGTVVPPTTLAPNPTSELDALRSQLQAAEQKIRDLEAEKTRTNASIGWNPPSQPDYPHPYYPPLPPQQYPFPPPQWQFPAPHGPSPASNSPASQNHGPQIPTSQSAPTYGFIGGPSISQNAQPVSTVPKPLKWQPPLRVANTPVLMPGSPPEGGAAARDSTV